MGLLPRLCPLPLCAALALAGCSRATVRIPARDATPPLAALDVIGADKTLVLMVGENPQAVELAREDSLILIAFGEDGDGGIKDLSLVGNAVVTCADRGSGPPAGRATGFMRGTVSGSAPRYRAPRRKVHRFILRARDFAALCPGRGISEMVGQATVRTVNFHGGHSTSPRLEFRLAPAEPSAAPAESPGPVHPGGKAAPASRIQKTPGPSKPGPKTASAATLPRPRI